MLMNVVAESNGMSELLLKTRDVCITSNEKFEEYKRCKVCSLLFFFTPSPHAEPERNTFLSKV